MFKKYKILFIIVGAVLLIALVFILSFFMGRQDNNSSVIIGNSENSLSDEASATAPETTPITTPETTAPPVIINTTAASEEELLSILSDSDFLSADDKTITLSGEITLSENILIDFPVNFIVEGEVYGWCEIHITYFDNIDISIKFKEASYSNHHIFIVDAPESKLTWDGESIPDIGYVSERMNVLSYNGEKMDSFGLGGKGTEKLTHFAALLEDNSDIKNDLVWEIDGNIISGKCTYYQNAEALKNAKIAATSEGKITFEGKGVNSDGTINVFEPFNCVVTDGSGNKRVYSVLTVEHEYFLPVVNINLDGDKASINKVEYMNCKISIDGGNSGFDSISEASAGIQGRGHSTWNWAKKPYKIKFDEKTDVFGLGKAKKWVLLANYCDQSLIRNYVSFEMAKVCDNMRYTPSSYPVDVFINGEYVGVYSLGEQLEVKGNRIDIDESYEEVDTGYLLEIGGSENGVDKVGVDYFSTEYATHILIKSPDRKQISSDQFKYIREYVNKADKAIATLTNYEEYIDVDSFIDWLIIEEMTYNKDSAFNRSCYLIKTKGGKLELGPVWDFDLALGNFSVDNPNYNDWVSFGRRDMITTDDEEPYIHITWMNFLLKDENFRNKLRLRFDEVKDRILNTAVSKIDSMYEKIQSSADFNFTIWNTLGQSVGYQSGLTGSLRTYKEQVDYVKNFIYHRYNWLDENI